MQSVFNNRFEENRVPFMNDKPEREHQAPFHGQCGTDALYHAVFDQFTDGLVVMDPDGVFIEYNEAAHRGLGYSREEFGKLRIADIEPFQRAEERAASIKTALEKGRDEYEVRQKTRNGGVRYVHAMLHAMVLSGRTVLYALWRDITALKLAQGALSEPEERYRDLFENANDAIFIVDADHRYIDVNKKATELCGFSREEFLNMTIADVVPAEQIPKSEAEFVKLRDRGRYEKFTGKMRTKGGRWIDVEVNSSAIVKNNRVIGSRDIVRDITERKRAEDALRASENLLQTIIETEPECVKLVARDGSLLLMNRAGLAMIEADSLDQVKGKSIFALIAPEHVEAFKKNVEGVFQGKSGTLEFDMIGNKGRRLRLDTHAVPLRNEQNEIIALLAVTRDVTERKKLEEELIRSQKMESVGLLAGGIAHDFNNMLTAIVGNISIAKKYLISEEPIEKVSARLTEAEKASFRAKELTQQLLTFSRGGAPIKNTASIGAIIQESAGFALRGSDVQCSFIIPDDLWPVEVDEGQMSQVIHNLIINAGQSMPEGGTVTIECANIVVRTDAGLPLKEGRYVRTSIHDRGVGISHEHLHKIFDPYFTTKQKGSGLGLSITYSIVKKHQGLITVDSRFGLGTTFHIYLPASGSKVPLKEDKAELLITGEGRILVMDDEDAVRSVAAEMLRGLGYEVQVAGDGVEALRLYAEARESGNGFHAVIMDLTVPGGMGGKETLKRLHEIDPAVIAIASSGYSNDPVMADYRKYGFAGVMAKPYKISTLSVVVNNVLKPRN
jgi:PAS domain S-box-containing protein